MKDTIYQHAKAMEEETIAIRAYLHEHPELSSKEFETASYLKQFIKKLGLIIEEVPKSTGFTALLDTGNPGKTLGIRTDIDALPVKETSENLAGPRKYRSKKDGVMHACGHDGHMAIILSTISILVDLKDQLKGKIYFIFEEGEEIGSGIDAMLAHLKDKHIDAIYANHLVSFMKTGKVSISAGPKMAGVAPISFTIHGKGGHGSRPDLAVNPVFAAAHVLTALSTAWTNRIDVRKTVTLGLTEIHAGSAWNVIPDTATISGTLRFYDVEEGKHAVKVLKEVAEATASAHQCHITYDAKVGFINPPVHNDDQLAVIAQDAVSNILGEVNEENVQWFASEPFGRYRELCPILFAFIGMKDESYGSGAEHHNEYFDLDDHALLKGVLLTTAFAEAFLNKRD